jgi:polyisoprenoid-binding protein YceI
MSDTVATTTGLPLAVGTWAVDPNHSGVHFKVRHLGLSNVRGRFNDFDATLTVGETLDDVRVAATIQMASVDTNNADRDAHLLGTDFFTAAAHPTMEFRSTKITEDGGDYTLDGELTINGVTRPVSLPVEFTGAEVFPPTGNLHAGFVAEAQVNRNDFGIDFNMPLGVDKLGLGEKVKVELDLQFVAPSA